MSILKRSLALACILVPAAGLLSLGCGIFTLPVVGPKALVTNSHLIHFTVEITDQDGAPLSDVKVSMVKYSMTNDFFFGEVDKAATESPGTVNGKYACNVFGNYAVALTFEKAGYGSVSEIYAEADHVTHSPRGGFMAYPQVPNQPTKNVKKYPEQHVVLSKTP